jgi:hypothetical protein
LLRLSDGIARSGGNSDMIEAGRARRDGIVRALLLRMPRDARSTDKSR